MAKAKNKTEKKFSVDRMMLNVASSLVRDFRDNLDNPGFCSEFERALHTQPVAVVRGLSTTPTDEMSVAEFKATYQIESVLKRYRFQTDTYSDLELKSKAIASFLATQDRLANQDLTVMNAKSHRVLDLAASYIAKVLGVYDDAEHRDLCRFGRKASVGVPARSACEAARWEIPISGSREQIHWFRQEIDGVECVQNYLAAQLESDPNRSIFSETSSLTLTLVPKTFKSLRSIMPNSTIGSYLSFGLGEMMRKRLKRNGYDIRTLQQRHRYLACRASLDGNLVTADLSSASDSISVALVERIFPSDWFEILNRTRIGRVALPLPDDGEETIIDSLTFCTMGIGYTFPLQTLVFLALLKAIEHVTYHVRKRRTISVYGDDLIYPSSMHNNVLFYLQQFGFLINVEKTFSEGHFRESCGGDYYHGVDVRPFQPRNGPAAVGGKTYEAVLYKYVNGLLARWSEYEVGKTLDFLVSEIESVTGSCKLVPGDYPDDAGVKCPTLSSHEFLRRARVAHPKHLGHGVYRFSYLGLTSDTREEKRHEPYYWNALRRPIDIMLHDIDGQSVADLRTSVVRQYDVICGVRSDASPLSSSEVKPTEVIDRRYRRFVNWTTRVGPSRLCRTATSVTVSHTGRYTRRSGISCFGIRR